MANAGGTERQSGFSERHWTTSLDDDRGVSARAGARKDGGRTLYASSAVSCFARAAGNVTRISSYLRVGRKRRGSGQDGAGSRADVWARPLETRKNAALRCLERPALRETPFHASFRPTSLDELRTGTHRGESQSGMGKPSESYSAPPVDEVNVAETQRASAAAKSAWRVAGAVARTRRAHRKRV